MHWFILFIQQELQFIFLKHRLNLITRLLTAAPDFFFTSQLKSSETHINHINKDSCLSVAVGLRDHNCPSPAVRNSAQSCVNVGRFRQIKATQYEKQRPLFWYLWTFATDIAYLCDWNKKHVFFSRVLFDLMKSRTCDLTRGVARLAVTFCILRGCRFVIRLL